MAGKTTLGMDMPEMTVVCFQSSMQH